VRTDDAKPQLFLLPGDSLTFEQVMVLFTSLTGREPTEAELDEARRSWGEGTPTWTRPVVEGSVTNC
jgi:hypothetical protein